MVQTAPVLVYTFLEYFYLYLSGCNFSPEKPISDLPDVFQMPDGKRETD